MTDDKWQMLIELAKTKFEDVMIHTEDLLVQTSEGEIKAGTQDILEFTKGSMGYRIIRENKPVLLDKKMHFSHRQGDSAQTEYIFSDTELSHKISFYKEDDFGDWQKLDENSMEMFL